MSENQNLYIMPIESMVDALDRLSILRGLLDTPPVQSMVDLLDELLTETPNPNEVIWKYHEWASNILACEAPRVTGDRWRDFLLAAALQSENAFADMAASAAPQDSIVMQAMTKDLKTLQTLFLVDDGRVRAWCRFSAHVETHDWVRWSATESEPVDALTNSPIERLRAAFVKSEDWAQLTQTLYDYHRAQGSGALAEAWHCAWNGRLRPFMPAQALVPDPLLQTFEGERAALMDTLRRFEKGQAFFDLLLMGPRGMGKFDQLLWALRQMPALRLVYIDAMQLSDLRTLAQQLRLQPGKFVLCVDGLQPEAMPMLLAILDGIWRERSQNVLFAAILHSTVIGGDWPGPIVNFLPLEDARFLELAELALRCEGLPAQSAHTMAVPWAQQNGATLLSAVRFAQRMHDILTD